MVSVTLYTRVDCHLCDDVKTVLDAVRKDRAFDLTVVDIDTDTTLVDRYGTKVPVVAINNRDAFKYHLDAQAFRDALDRAEAMSK